MRRGLYRVRGVGSRPGDVRVDNRHIKEYLSLDNLPKFR